MSITFMESKLDGGYLQINWDAETKREFHRVLQSIKTMIPKEHRAWVPDLKVWTIAPEGIAIYQDIKRAIEESSDKDGELLAPIIDEVVEDEAVLNAMSRDLRALPDCMKEKALFAIEAAMGRIDVPVEFSLSRGLFGAWNKEHGHWFYENGRYSQYSPSEWDNRSVAAGHRRLDRACENLAEFLDALDETDQQQERRRFRLAMLEKYGYRCYVCTNRPDNLRYLHMHRVLPGNIGGQYIESNVVILCALCHRQHEGLSWSQIAQAHDKRLGLMQSESQEQPDSDMNECYDPEVDAFAF